jgi:hypothetical protein
MKKKHISKGLHQLVYDVFFNPENTELITDTLWHDGHTTSFDMVSHLLEIDCSHANPDKMKEDLETYLKGL